MKLKIDAVPNNDDQLNLFLNLIQGMPKDLTILKPIDVHFIVNIIYVPPINFCRIYQTRPVNALDVATCDLTLLYAHSFRN